MGGFFRYKRPLKLLGKSGALAAIGRRNMSPDMEASVVACLCVYLCVRVRVIVLCRHACATEVRVPMCYCLFFRVHLEICYHSSSPRCWPLPSTVFFVSALHRVIAAAFHSYSIFCCVSLPPQPHQPDADAMVSALLDAGVTVMDPLPFAELNLLLNQAVTVYIPCVEVCQ